MIYTFVAFVLLIYDENHHPYLLLFMGASTIIFSVSAWIYIQSINTRGKVVSLLSGFVLAFLAMLICESAWDWVKYSSNPSIAAGYRTPLIYGAFVVFYGFILFLPALIGLMKSTFNKETTA
jgi:hypothetical protein